MVETSIHVDKLHKKLNSIEYKLINLVKEGNHISDELRKINNKVTLLANDLLEAKADISILQEQME